jgi:hypothetical protein
MTKKALNKNLGKAKNSKKDEFYTQLSDIERELKHLDSSSKCNFTGRRRRQAGVG